MVEGIGEGSGGPDPGRRGATGLAVLLLVLGFVAGAMALSVTLLPAEHISLFNAPTAASRFVVTDLSQNLAGHGKGSQKVDVLVSLANTGTAPHNATVVVGLVNATSGQYANQTLSTGIVAPGATVSLTASFSGTLYSDMYDWTFLSVRDVS